MTKCWPKLGQSLASDVAGRRCHTKVVAFSNISFSRMYFWTLATSLLVPIDDDNGEWSSYLGNIENPVTTRLFTQPKLQRVE